jgi:UDP-N-acetylglucosamine 2-epimerase (non-hydrolysing)
MTGIEEALAETPPSCLVVQGDTNSVLAGALVASKLRIPLAHLEAGLRSGDREMPEEINRIITDHISDLLLPPTQECAEALFAEGIAADSVSVVGNTVVDSVYQSKELAAAADLSRLGLTPGGYYLLTLHRPANVDRKEDLQEIFGLLETVGRETGKEFYFPAHPRTKGSIEKHGLALPACVRLASPVGYTEFLALQMNAAAIFTDSGGIQEEACILQIPCITLRDTTERPETVQVGANVLAYRDAEGALKGLRELSGKSAWENPFGDGHAAERCLEELVRRFSREA